MQSKPTHHGFTPGAFWCGGKRIGAVLFGISLVLSIVNIILFVLLRETEHRTAEIAAHAGSILQQARSQSLIAPFVANVAIDDIFDVPIRTTVPIKTTVNVPVVVPLIGQKATIAVPIDAEVPIDTTVRVPIKTTVPVSVKISGSSFDDVLQQLQNLLAELATDL